MSPSPDAEGAERFKEHRPVLLEEVLERLDPRPGEIHVDCTLGAGGHAAAVLSRLGEKGLLIGIDRDPEAIEAARPRLEAAGFPFRIIEGPYSRLQEYLRLVGLAPEGAVDGLLLDLGVSSLQLDRPERGFSFLRDGPLDMRMSPVEGDSARAFLANAPTPEIERVLRDYGEEPAAGRIARAIDRARKEEGIETTGRLARIIEGILPRQGKKTHPATRSFQGIRIAVNRELEHLRLVLRDLDRWVKPGGRVVVLSYHSLEDRMVKESFRERTREGIYRVVPPSPLRPGAKEIESNPRSRSARLRSVVREGKRSP
ncbi:MAG TPA: 16S rRNA (cytosine(1402)-N(4))-methyltransferase RsmH [Planctomycetota bacterium]|nr:16S rRNA (cytosine(1402)-N(4))-methyltransferase RsmH [Planctomycetota bacterium]